MKKVILEGCNGDWSRRRYLPFLTQKAIDNRLELIAVDIVTEPSLSADELWLKAMAEGKVGYLDKVGAREQYELISSADYVFIVTPDKTHCEIAGFWLPRLAQSGKIFVEKPLDASVESATTLSRKENAVNKIFGFDHYLISATTFLSEKTTHLEAIGDIKRVEFRIFEPYPIEPSRTGTMEKGVILDLFSHVVPMVSRIVDGLSPDTIRSIQPVSVRLARYKDCPIPGESFATTDFSINHIPVSAAVGYGVSAENNKSLFVYGTKGRIEIDFANSRFITPVNSGSGGKNLQKRHVESFMESVLRDDIAPMPEIGVMDFSTAMEVLKLLEKCREMGEALPDYTCGASLHEIV
jgi:predicted dehydrogenase